MRRSVLAAVVVALVGAAPAQAEITAIYPKKVCYQTSHGKTKSGGVTASKPLFWGVVGLRWCQRIGRKHHGDVVNYSGPLASAGVSSWGRKNEWRYEGVSKQTVKCISPHLGMCSYLRVKVWLEFDANILVLPDKHHTMKFTLLVGNGREVWG